MTTATFSEFAALIGVKPSYITQLRKAGRLVLTENGKQVEVEASQQRIKETLDPSKAGVVARHAQDRGAALLDKNHVEDALVMVGDAEDEPAATEATPEYQSWRARRERAVALQEELKLGEAAGDYLKKSDAQAAVAEAFTSARTALEGLPDRIAQTLAAEQDEQRIRAVLAEEIEYTLNNLSVALGALGKKES